MFMYEDVSRKCRWYKTRGTLKYGCSLFMERLCNFFNVKLAAVLAHWKIAIIVSAGKQKSSESEYKNYRETSVFGKVHLGRCLAEFHLGKGKRAKQTLGAAIQLYVRQGVCKQNIALLLVTKDCRSVRKRAVHSSI